MTTAVFTAQQLQVAWDAYRQLRDADPTLPELTVNLGHAIERAILAVLQPPNPGVELVWVPLGVLEQALQWVYCQPSDGLNILGEYVDSDTLAERLQNVVERWDALGGLEMPCPGHVSFEMFRASTTELLRGLTPTGMDTPVQAPLPLVQAILDGAYLPETGGYKDGPSVEDLCAALETTMTDWTEVPITEFPDEADTRYGQAAAGLERQARPPI
jgi:hypothetical protein